MSIESEKHKMILRANILFREEWIGSLLVIKLETSYTQRKNHTTKPKLYFIYFLLLLYLLDLDSRKSLINSEIIYRFAILRALSL